MLDVHYASGYGIKIAAPIKLLQPLFTVIFSVLGDDLNNELFRVRGIGSGCHFASHQLFLDLGARCMLQE